MARRALLLILLFTLLACSMTFAGRGNCNPYDGTDCTRTQLNATYNSLACIMHEEWNGDRIVDRANTIATNGRICLEKVWSVQLVRPST
jgi:hypothetical protein